MSPISPSIVADPASRHLCAHTQSADRKYAHDGYFHHITCICMQINMNDLPQEPQGKTSCAVHFTQTVSHGFRAFTSCAVGQGFEQLG